MGFLTTLGLCEGGTTQLTPPQGNWEKKHISKAQSAWYVYNLTSNNI